MTLHLTQPKCELKEIQRNLGSTDWYCNVCKFETTLYHHDSDIPLKSKQCVYDARWR